MKEESLLLAEFCRQKQKKIFFFSKLADSDCYGLGFGRIFKMRLPNFEIIWAKLESPIRNWKMAELTPEEATNWGGPQEQRNQ